jgi:Tat protein secretion system quality control protein TatD with DNase activity
MDTLRYVADLRGTSQESLAAVVEANAARAFPRLP